MISAPSYKEKKAVSELDPIDQLLYGKAKNNSFSIQRRIFYVDGCLTHLQKLNISLVEKSAGFIRDEFIPCLENGQYKDINCSESGLPEGGNFMIDPSNRILTSKPENKNIKALFPDQSIIPIDTTFSKVQHVDEVINFIGTGDNWHVVYPSKTLGYNLLKKALEYCETQNLPFKISIPCPDKTVNYFDIDKIKNFLSAKPDRAGSKVIREAKKASDSYLSNAIAITEDRSKHLVFPYMFASTAWPSAVNLVNVNGTALIPCQHSIRLPLEDIKQILANFYGLDSAQLDPYQEHLKRLSQQAILVPYPDLKSLNRIRGKIFQSFNLKSANIKIENGKGAIISKHKTVDLFEAFIAIELTMNEIPYFFVETSDLNLVGGNLHCATNRGFKGTDQTGEAQSTKDQASAPSGQDGKDGSTPPDNPPPDPDAKDDAASPDNPPTADQDQGDTSKDETENHDIRVDQKNRESRSIDSEDTPLSRQELTSLLLSKASKLQAAITSGNDWRQWLRMDLLIDLTKQNIKGYINVRYSMVSIHRELDLLLQNENSVYAIEMVLETYPADPYIAGVMKRAIADSSEKIKQFYVLQNSPNINLSRWVIAVAYSQFAKAMLRDQAKQLSNSHFDEQGEIACLICEVF